MSTVPSRARSGKRPQDLSRFPVVEALPHTSRAAGAPGGWPYCQSRVQRGHWKGFPCGNGARHKVGPEVCCGTHIAQAMARNPGAAVEVLPEPEQ